MSSVKLFALCLASLLGANAVAADKPNYQKGMLISTGDPRHKSYTLKAGAKIYQISNCGEFQNGQEVNFLAKDDKIYIAHEGAKDYKCAIESTTEATDPKLLPTVDDMSMVYMRGTILGFSIRRDTHVSGGSSGTRKAKVYELQGPALIYQIDYCGAFQAGEFTPRQELEFRVDTGGGRLYVRHDGNKEYSCQLEGTRKPDAQPAASPASAASAAVASTAKLSIASAPDGADIEIDGRFSGNTPSDIEVPEGEHSIVMKKSGYKNWERKLNVTAGSGIHLNAEMEKSTNP